MKNIIHSDFRIKTIHNEIKTLSNLIADSSSFSQNLAKSCKENNNVEIFLTCMYDFLVAFFGAINAKCNVYVLPKNIPSNARLLINDVNFKNFLRHKNISVNLEKSLDENAIFYLQTSGSTGDSKVIAKRLRDMINEARFLKDFLYITSDNIFCSSASHQHMYGQTWKVFLPLVSGAMVESRELIYPELIFEYAKNIPENKAILITSPTLLDTLRKYENTKILQTFRFAISAGSKLDSKVREEIKCLKIIEIYGSTENGAMAYNNGSLDDKFRIFEPVSMRVDSTSRLIIKSPWQEDEFISNDCAVIENGILTLLGRIDRIVKLHDKRISLDMIERKIKENPLIENAYIGLMDNEKENKRLSAIIILSQMGKKIFRNSGKKGIVKELNNFLKKDFGSIVRYFHIRDALPYNQQGKITKKDFRDSIACKITPKFELVEQTQNSLKAQANINQSCFYFNGHFPSLPVVPGFVELGFVFELAKLLAIKTENVAEIQSVKFTAIVRPSDTLELKLERKDNKLLFNLFANNKECANGRILLKDTQ